MGKALTFEAVRKIGLALPDIEEGMTYGARALMHRGTMIVCMASHRSAEPHSLVVRMDFASRDQLIVEQPEIYYLTDHYVGYPCVLVRLTKVAADALPGLVRMAWRFVASGQSTRSRTSRRRARPR